MIVLALPLRRAVLTLALSSFVAFLPACKDKDKENAANAGRVVATLATLAEKDVAEVERGLPEGAKMLAPLFAKGDPRQDIASVRSALKKVRRDNMDLNVAKSTFFALTDDKGVAIRNDLDTDVMAGQNLITIFPDLAKAQTGYVTTTGSFPPSGPRAENDKDWVAGVPVKKDDGSVVGLFVTGWSYRYFARHLSEALKSELVEEAKKKGDPGKIPVYYIAVFDKASVYTAPLVPDVNQKALIEADLVGKTAGGTFQGSITITDRVFGYGAARVPKLGPETGIVILWSEV
jgi:hypothetical protein